MNLNYKTATNKTFKSNKIYREKNFNLSPKHLNILLLFKEDHPLLCVARLLEPRTCTKRTSKESKGAIQHIRTDIG